jgi:hypothetical protein
MAENKKQPENEAAPSVASTQDNRRLEHPQGGATTRDDLLDAGVPMLPGDPREPTGPEDALGPGPKRGTYVDRIGPSSYHPHTVEAVPDEERVEGGPQWRLVAQRPRAEEIGDAPRLKGGVETGDRFEGLRR